MTDETIDIRGGNYASTGGNYAITPNLGPHQVHISTENGELLTITADGTLVFGPAFTTKDEASIAFWRVLADCLPGFRQMLIEGSGSR